MKTINKFCITALLLLPFYLHAQDNIRYNTYFYDYLSGPLNSGEVGEAIASDLDGYYYAAGERAKDNAAQSVRVVKYRNGIVARSATFDLNNYREYVTKVLNIVDDIFVICNAVNINSGLSYLLIIKYNKSLQQQSYQLFTAASYFNPADAVFIGSRIYMACNKREGNDTVLAVLRMNTSLNILSTQIYNYTSAGNSIETPKSLDYNSYDTSVYVAGNIYSNATGRTATLVMKLDSTLTTRRWVQRGSFADGKNIYNSIAVNASYAYVAGCVFDVNRNATNWMVRSLSRFDGHTLNSRVYIPSGYATEALKITYSIIDNVIVTGYAKKTDNTGYNIQIGKYSISLAGTVNYYGISLPNGSVLNDAVSTNNGQTFVTGKKYVSGSQHMFLYKFDILNGGTIMYRDSLINTNAGGNKLALSSYQSAEIGLAGYKNNNASIFQPVDYSFMLREYFYVPTIVKYNTVDEANSKNEFKSALMQNIPNPCNRSTTINFTLPDKYVSAKIILTDKSGKVLKQIGVSGHGKGNVQLDASTLASGSYNYALYVDEKMIAAKQMLIVK